MKSVRIGVIGCGYWGPNLIRNLNDIPDATLVSVADLREDRLSIIQKSYPHVITTTDYKSLFSMDLDAVVIATPPSTHYSLAEECLRWGLNVLIEKPMTLKSQDSQALIDLAEARDLVLMVGHTFEYNPAVQMLKEIIETGELGSIYYIDAIRVNLGLFQQNLDVLWDLAPHDISILLYLLNNDPISVSAQGMSCVFNGVCDLAYMNLIFPDNILAHVHVSWLDPCKIRRITVVGSKKMVVYDDVEADKIKIFDKGIDSLPYTGSFQDFQLSYRNGNIIIPNIRFTEPLKLECEHFVDCVLNHSTPRSNGFDGLRVVRVLEAAQVSLLNGHHQEMLR